MEFKVYIADSSPLCEESLFKYYYEKMPESRRSKIDKITAPGKKTESLAAGILLEYALRQNFPSRGIPQVSYTDLGKPVSEECGISISHSHGRIMCAIAPTEIGCDIEKIGKKDFEKIAKRFFSSEENEYALSSEKNFTRLWTLKESYVKYLGKGLTKPFDSFFFRGLDGKTPISVIDNDVFDKKCHFYIVDLNDDYCYSVCVSEEDEPPIVEMVNLMGDILCIK